MPNKFWNGKSRLKYAVLVDVDGTLAGIYKQGKRPIRPSSVKSLRLLASHMPVFLWSVAGADNGLRLIHEYPEIEPFISGVFDKNDFPLHKVEKTYAIDDEEWDNTVRRCQFLALVDTYSGGKDSGMLSAAAMEVVAQYNENKEPKE